MIETALPHILLVDDEPAVRAALSQALLHTSAQQPTAMAASVTLAASAQEAMDMLLDVAGGFDGGDPPGPESGAGADVESTLPTPPFPYDLLMVDMCLGPDSGLDLLRSLRRRACGPRMAQSETFEGMGLLLMTGRATAGQMAQAIRLGVDDLLLKPITVRALRDAVARCHQRLLQRRSQISQLREFADELLHLRERSANAAKGYAALRSAVLDALLAALAVREPGAVEHSLRVQTYASFFARALNYPEALRPQLEHAALLHDIGKIGLSDILLFRPDALAPGDLERTHPHTLLGEQILGRIGFLRAAALIVRHHHEHYNGRGYPDGLAGEDIPLGARIFAIVDALDALTTDRPYRPARTFAEARDEIQRCAGQQFDPRLCDAFARIPAQTWRQIRAQVADRLRARIPLAQASDPTGHAPPLAQTLPQVSSQSDPAAATSRSANLLDGALSIGV